MKNINKIIALSLLGIFLNFSFVLASTSDDFEKMFNDFFESNSDITIIKNNIEASSNSGGNIAESGEIIEGKSNSSLKIESTVNGEVLRDVDIVIENEDEAIIDYESFIEINDDKLKIESTRNINGQVEKRTDEFLIDKNLEEDLDSLFLKDSQPLDLELKKEEEKNQENILEPKNEENNIEEDNLVFKFFSIILDLFKNNIDKISRLFY